jgi:predicted ATPase
MAPAALPQPATSFVGRIRELADLHQALSRGERWLALTGLGGIGKSRVALACADEQARRGAFERSSYVPLETELDPQAVSSRLAAAMGLGVEGDGDPWEALATAIGNDRWLLVLDNLDALTEVGAALIRLLTWCPHLSIITTSREPLGLGVAWTYPVGGLGLPAEGDADRSLLDHDAVQLFGHRAKRADVRFQITPDNAPAVAEACRLVDGMPLAIELAASWLRMMPVDEIAREIRAGIDILASSSRNLPERHRSLRAVLDHTWQTTSPEEREAMIARATFHGGFTREADAAVAGSGSATLERLVARSLLRDEGGGRFGFHPLVHRYVDEQLQARPELRAEIELRHGAYFLGYVAASIGRDDEMARLDVEIANVLAATERAAARDDRSMLVGFMRGLAVDGAYYGARGHTDRSLALLRAAIDAARASGELVVVHRLLGKLGNVQKLHHGELDQALETYQAALAIAERLDDPHHQVVLLSVIGMLRFEQGAADAEAHLSRAFDLAKAHGDTLGLNHVLQHQAFLAGGNDDWAKARTLLAAGLDALERGPGSNPAGSTEAAYHWFMTLLNLGEAERKLGRLAASLELRRTALAMAEANDNELWKATALQEIGEVLHGLGDRPAAHDHFERALASWIRHGVTAKVRQLRAWMADGGYPIP